jgi:4-hydroxy-3-polyprenylbenzoate decarboxylase
MTELADRSMKADGPALLFENPQGYEMPVLMNAFGSAKRMCMVLGVDRLDEAGREITDFIEAEMPKGLIQKLKMLPKVKRLADLFPRTVSRAPCQEVVLRDDEVDLQKLPVLKCWPDDGGPFFTLPVVITCHPETGIRNVGMYRMQVYDRRTTGMHWHAHKDSAHHYRVAERRNERLPVAVALGPDPITTFRPPRRCPRVSTSCSSPASSAGARWRWSSASPRTSRCRRAARS